MAVHLPIEPLKPRSVFEPVPRCEPSTNQHLSHRYVFVLFAYGYISVEYNLVGIVSDEKNSTGSLTWIELGPIIHQQGT